MPGAHWALTAALFSGMPVMAPVQSVYDWQVCSDWYQARLWLCCWLHNLNKLYISTVLDMVKTTYLRKWLWWHIRKYIFTHCTETKLEDWYNSYGCRLWRKQITPSNGVIQILSKILNSPSKILTKSVLIYFIHLKMFKTNNF